MKMKQKGIAIAAIAAIVVVVVVVVVGAGAFLVLRGGGGAGGLPLYSGATKAGTIAGLGFSSSDFVENAFGRGQSVPADVSADVYTATGSVSDILNYYKTEMAAQGWTKQYENTFNQDYMGMSIAIGLLYFEKVDRAAAVCAVNYTYQSQTYTYFALAEGPKTVFETWSGYQATPGGGAPGGGISGATSLSFTVSSTIGGVTNLTYKAKNIGANNLKLRIEGTAAGQEITYIINGETQQAWIYTAGQWIDMSSTFSSYWSTWSESLSGYQESLSGWTSGTYTSPDGSVTISNIQVDPTLDDSLFVH